ncbi:hypothetical protein BH09SUM1_BH09SUM1_04260 [soil metagenome]
MSHTRAGLIFIALFAATFTGCATRRDKAASASANAPAAKTVGKIQIQYRYTEEDRTNPPVEFHIWRADAAEGPFAQVNEKPMKGAAKVNPGEITSLLWDDGLTLGQGYYYYLEGVDSKGVHRKLTDVARATALIPSAAPLKPANQSSSPEVKKMGKPQGAKKS